ncbi:MAG: alpha/beta hydrolase [Acidimicrobiales bacterium]|jgi:pimeloyl-ACP methyl ester carboxylesterase|nr:alpha/beta hydrolase [Acidimicrobiales bacterium]|tara:strand:- start:285 stop:1022 length:738 start_codon:yes stop_codon:yes gene_type:complete
MGTEALRITAADGISIAVDSSGDAGAAGRPPIVATHGWANDRSVWTPLVGELVGEPAGGHQVVTWDLRGHGDSDAPPPGAYSRKHVLADLAAVRDHAVGSGGGSAILMGHSLGGFLCLAHAVDHPDEVAGLVLVATGPGFRKAEAREQWNESVRESAVKIGVPPGSEEISMHHDSYVIDHLAEIQVPVLVLLGEHDKRFAASASLFERDLDVRESVVVPDQGHMVHVKAPAECAAAVRRFIAGLA